MPKLTDQQLHNALLNLPSWHLDNGKLTREWTFPDFAAAIDFVNRVATIAEQAGHHPDIDIRYNRVTLGLVTHDAGGISDKDIAMAAQLAPLP